MENNQKNVKISEKHHEMLKNHCEKNGLKIYKVLEKFIEDKYGETADEIKYYIDANGFIVDSTASGAVSISHRQYEEKLISKSISCLNDKRKIPLHGDGTR
jgi:dTDP-D-glucose 4,6-dehydratase